MKKKKMVTRLLALSLTLVMAGGLLGGCGKAKPSSSEAVMDKDHVYKAEYFSLPEGIENVNRMKVCRDRIYMDGYNSKSNHQYQIFYTNPDGTDTKVIYEQKNVDSTVNCFTVDQEGNLFLSKTSYEEDTSDPANIQYKNKYYLVKVDEEGKEIFSREIDLKEGSYINDMAVDKDGNTVILTYQGLVVYDKDGKVLTRAETGESFPDSVFVTKDGTIMVSEYSQDYTKKQIKKLLPAEKKLSDPFEIEGVSNLYMFYSSNEYDLYLNDQSNVYGYNFESKEKTKLLNWINSDMNASFINTIAGLSDGRIVMLSNNWIKDTSELAVLTKVPPEDVVEKEILVLATIYADMNLSASIIEFNKKNDKYRIVVKDYSEYNVAGNYTAASEKLNADIISGDVPDILSIADPGSFESLSSKGLFMDLNEFIDKDETFNKSDYLENIFAAFEKDGKQFSLVPYFSCFTFVGKTSDVGENMGWTLDDLNKVMAGKPEGTKIMDNATREAILEYGEYLCIDEFIDWKNNKANFEDESFIRLLEFANQFPAREKSDNGMTEAVAYYDEARFDDLRSGKTLLQISYMSQFNDLHRMQTEEFGEEVTLIGFPTESKNGSAISPGLQLAISSKSKLKDAAWDFVKMLFMDEFQDNLMWGWQTKLSSLEKKMQKEQKPVTYIDETGKEVEYEETTIIDGKEVKVGRVTQEECDKVMTFLKSLSQVMRSDEKITAIIEEEAGAYFAGQKSAEEVAKLVQNRVQTYLSESR